MNGRSRSSKWALFGGMVIVLVLSSLSQVSAQAEPVQDSPAAVRADAASDSGETVRPDMPERGRARASLLRKLIGSDEVRIDPDPRNPPSVPQPLRLDEAVTFALENNQQVSTASAKTDASRWELRGAYSEFLPVIEYQHRSGKQHSQPASYHDSLGNTVNDSHQHTWDRTISVRQPIIDASILADILSRSYTLDSVKAQEMGVREQTAMDTIKSFLRVTQARAVIGFAEHYKANLDKIGQRIRDRAEGGGASKVEVERITARSTVARSAIIEARSEYQAAMIEFRRLTGVSPTALVLPESLAPAVPHSAEDILVSALRANPEYLSSQKQADAAYADMGKAFSNLLPKFAVEYTNYRSWNAGGAAFESPSYSGGIYPYQNDRRVMGVFSWKLNGGVDIAQGLANRYHAREAASRAIDTQQKLEESIKVGFDALHAANGRIEAVSQAVDANTRVTAAFEEQYLAGTRQLLDLLDAYERLYQSQTELTRLLVAESTASFLVRRQMGELLPALLSSDAP